MKLSVVIPYYSHAEYIGKSIESIMNQSYNCYELIIFDNNSKDSSVEVIKSYIKNFWSLN